MSSLSPVSVNKNDTVSVATAKTEEQLSAVGMDPKNIEPEDMQRFVGTIRFNLQQAGVPESQQEKIVQRLVAKVNSNDTDPEKLGDKLEKTIGEVLLDRKENEDEEYFQALLVTQKQVRVLAENLAKQIQIQQQEKELQKKNDEVQPATENESAWLEDRDVKHKPLYGSDNKEENEKRTDSLDFDADNRITYDRVNYILSR